MTYRVLTVSREFGSGGGRIAQTIAGWLGWNLLDGDIINRIAHQAHVDSGVVSSYDERLHSWLQRVNEEAVRGVAMASGQPLEELDIFDARVMTQLTRKMIEEAYSRGNCVIVGRGAQCILHGKPDVFHVFVYALAAERVERLRRRLPAGTDVEERLRTVDAERAKYLQLRFGKSWSNPHLYNLMISSCEDEDATARVILQAMTGSTSQAGAPQESGSLHLVS